MAWTLHDDGTVTNGASEVIYGHVSVEYDMIETTTAGSTERTFIQGGSRKSVFRIGPNLIKDETPVKEAPPPPIKPQPRGIHVE